MLDLFQPRIVQISGEQRIHRCEGPAPYDRAAQARIAAQVSAAKRRLSDDERRARRATRRRRERARNAMTPEQKAQAMQRRIDALLAAGPKARAISIENRSRRAREAR